jgi:hypothetical protein
MVGIKLDDLEYSALERKVSVNNLIKDILGKRKDLFWVESEQSSLFWDRKKWNVSKLTEDNIEFAEFAEEKLDEAISRFIDNSVNDKLSKTDEEVYATNLY